MDPTPTSGTPSMSFGASELMSAGKTIRKLNLNVLAPEWAVQKGEGGRNLHKIKPMSMDFNYFTINRKVYPDTSPLRVPCGETVRIRLGNLISFPW